MFATKNVKRALGECGIGEDRIVLTPSMPNPDHLCRYRFADIYLDSFPYNGHTMASDALYMDVPTVTMSGRTMPSRVAGSFLQRLDLGEWVAEDFEGYVARAVRLAQDPDLRAGIRRQISDAKQLTAMFDGARYVREFEAALCHMAERARAGLPPASPT